MVWHESMSECTDDDVRMSHVFMSCCICMLCWMNRTKYITPSFIPHGDGEHRHGEGMAGMYMPYGGWYEAYDVCVDDMLHVHVDDMLHVHANVWLNV